jgi:hypothetical protein
VKSRPKDPEARYELGRALAAAGHNDEAVTHLRAALDAAPDDELARRIHSQLGRSLACNLELPEAAQHYRTAGSTDRADQIEEISTDVAGALERLTTLRSSTAELARMEAELEELVDPQGVAAMAGRRKTMDQEIAEIEDNLSEVRAALCR